MTHVTSHPAISLNFNDVLVKAGFSVYSTQQFGPCGLRVTFASGERLGSIIVTQSDVSGGDSTEWVHASIAFTDSDPTYEDLTVLHRAVYGRKRYAYQVFAPQASHVNIHEHALHLWGRVDGKPVLPDFGQFGTI